MIALKSSGIFSEGKTIELMQKKWSRWTPDPFIWVDGSGVSRYNMFTPRSLVEVLKKFIEPRLGIKLKRSFQVVAFQNA